MATVRGNDDVLNEPLPAEWMFGDQISATRTLFGTRAICLASAPAKGALGSGEFAGMLVRDSRVTPINSERARLVINYGGAGEVTQVPASEFDVDTDRLDQIIEKHPDFASEFEGSLGLERKEAIRFLLQNPPSGTLTSEQELAQAVLTLSAEASAVYSKALEGRTHYAVFPPKVRVTDYYTTLPSLNVGGTIYTAADIIELTGIPSLPPGYTYLRQSDSYGWTGTFWKVTRSWIGAPEWDDIYPLEYPAP